MNYYGSQEEHNAAMSAQGYAEAEAAAAQAQAEAEYDEMINKLANDYIQSLDESIWMNPSMSDVAKAFIAGFELQQKKPAV